MKDGTNLNLITKPISESDYMSEPLTMSIGELKEYAILLEKQGHTPRACYLWGIYHTRSIIAAATSGRVK